LQYYSLNTKNMKEKFDFIFDIVSSNMRKLDEKKITFDQAKAMAALAKQANNVIATQLDAAKFLHNNEKSQKSLSDVGLVSSTEA
jgi:hypothetical protein